MKLVRYGDLGEEQPGIIDGSGGLRDLSSHLKDVNPESLGNLPLMNTIRDLNLETLPLLNPDIRIGAPVGLVGKLLCVGFNSKRHMIEMGISPINNKDMVVFLKPTSAICGARDPIYYARYTKKLDWEAELGVVIGKKGKYISKDRAKEYIFGYVCINDLSDRYWQLETGDSQYTKGKGFDNSAPIGPYLVTKDEIPDANNLTVKLWVNGELRQDFNTRDYIHSDEDVICYLSKYFTLYPGDIISMGSAPGSAKAWGEDKYLKPNDKVTLLIQGLGQQEKMVIIEPMDGG